MTPEHNLINELYHKYSEWVEEVGDLSPFLMINILAKLVIKEREDNSYLVKIIEAKTNSNKGF